MTVLLGISGGIAAYKSAELVRRFRRRGDDVRVVLTRAAREFVTARTLAALSGQPVLKDLFPSGPDAIEHIAVAQAATVALVAPATAHLLARMAHGLADDYLTTLLLATPAPVVAAPAMNVQMWQNPATQANVELLRSRGVTVVPPASGELACGMVGEGRMAELDAIIAACDQAVAGRSESPAGPAVHTVPAAETVRGMLDVLPPLAPRETDFAGEIVLITAGPTREALDPVRYISNRSSGRMGYALAAAARRRGAQVRLVSGPTNLPAPAGIAHFPVTTAAEMEAATLAQFDDCTFAFLAAAVADYRPVHASPTKIKKSAGPATLELEPTPDILAILGRRKRHQRLIGFAAETDAVHGLDLARAKLAAKRADLIIFNDVSRHDIGFDVDDNEVTVVSPHTAQRLPRASKSVIADQILDAALRLNAHAAVR